MACRNVRSSSAKETIMNTTQRRLNFGPAIAIATLSFVLATGCGANREAPVRDVGAEAPDTSSRGSTLNGSADAIERRGAQEGGPSGSADAIERRGNPSFGRQACSYSADAAERLQPPCTR
jgi:hypothetical protein